MTALGGALSCPVWFAPCVKKEVCACALFVFSSCLGGDVFLLPWNTRECVCIQLPWWLGVLLAPFFSTCECGGIDKDLLCPVLCLSQRKGLLEFHHGGDIHPVLQLLSVISRSGVGYQQPGQHHSNVLCLVRQDFLAPGVRCSPTFLATSYMPPEFVAWIVRWCLAGSWNVVALSGSLLCISLLRVMLCLLYICFRFLHWFSTICHNHFCKATFSAP